MAPKALPMRASINRDDRYDLIEHTCTGRWKGPPSYPSILTEASVVESWLDPI